MGYNIDKDGYILDGKFAGRHIDTVLAYTESLEAAVETGQPPKAPKGKTPAEELENANRGRVDNTHALTNQRLEDDDRAAFIARVGSEEAGKYLERIQGVLKTLHPNQRVVKDVHWAVYVQLKSQEEGFAERLLNKPVVPPVAPPPASENSDEETPEEKEAREAEDRAVELRKTADAKKKTSQPSGGAPPPPAPPKPAAAPPRAVTAPPPPAGRAPASGEKKPKLVANEKIKRAAREWGMPIDKYLLDLEARGYTQEDLERGSAPREETRRKSVFDRPVAS
jgi:hypothetical protein